MKINQELLWLNYYARHRSKDTEKESRRIYVDIRATYTNFIFNGVDILIKSNFIPRYAITKIIKPIITTFSQYGILLPSRDY